MATTAFIGKGTVYARKSTDAGLTTLGNCSKLSIALAEDKKELMDYENSGGGIADRVSRVKSVSMSMTSHRITATMLEKFLRASTATTNVAAIIKNEAITDVQQDKLTPFAKLVGTPGVVVKEANYVTGEALTNIVVGTANVFVFAPSQSTIQVYEGTTLLTEGAAPTGDYVTTTTGITPHAGGPNTLANDDDLTVNYCKISGVLSSSTDYTIGRMGIIPKSGGTIANNDDLRVTYVSKAASTIEPMTTTNSDFVVVFDGLNEANSDKAVKVVCHRVQFSPIKSLDLIGDDFANIEIEGELMADSTQTNSKFFSVTMES